MKQDFAYSATYLPPAPTLHIYLAAPETQLVTAEMTALIDTGADVSFAPVDVLESIQAPLGKDFRVRSLWGERRQFSGFVVDVRIDGITLPGTEIMGYAGDEVVLGRDVLNKLWLGLDGPANTTEVSESNPRRKRRQH